MPPKRVVVVALVLTSALGMAALWGWMATRMPSIVQETPLWEFSARHAWTTSLGRPSFAWIGLAGAALLFVAWLIRGRASGTATLATLAAVAFLVLGLWLPVASRLWCRAMTARSAYLDADFALAHPLALFGWMVVLPIAVATILTHVEARLSRRTIRIGLAVGLACSIASRYGAAVATSRCIGPVPAVDCPSLVFVSYVHVLLAAGLVACGSLLAVALARRSRPDTTHACKRYLAFLIVVSIPNLIAIDQSFRLVEHLRRWLHTSIA